MNRTLFLLMSLLFLSLPPLLLAQAEEATMAESVSDTAAQAETEPPPLPPINVIARDNPNDNGHAVQLSWTLSPDDSTGRDIVTAYKIFYSLTPDAPDEEWKNAGIAIAGATSYTHQGVRDEGKPGYLPKNTDLYYRIAAASDVGMSEPAYAPVVQAKDNWFNTSRIVVLVFVGVFLLLTIRFINIARQGKRMYVRPLAGIEAVDEAIGRATEMGKPILYVIGLGTASDIATIASFSVLGRVAKKVAEYQTPILVPCYDPIVLTVAEETVKAGYSDAGRPDDFKEDSVYFVTQSQFAYVAAVNGTMLRELPATNIYLGKFFAESLLLAETGAITGSIQISGTDEIAQLPFFVVATDYTLIGEELYAASVYLNREPILMGTLKAQDWAKGFVIVVVLLGLVLRTFNPELVRTLLQV